MEITLPEKLTVFIADDSVSIRGSLSSYLLSNTPDIEIVGFAGTAPDAVRGIRELKPDVVILDIRMPGGNGIDVLSAIRRDGRATQIMMFTNEAASMVRAKCMALGADYFFDKSSEFERLHEVLETLSRTRSERGCASIAAHR